jgi:hypothetical protein
MWCDHCRTECEAPKIAKAGIPQCPQCDQALRSSREDAGESNNDLIRLFENLNDDVLAGAEPDRDRGPNARQRRVDPAHPVALFPGEARSNLGNDPEKLPSLYRSPSQIALGAAGFLGALFGYLGVLTMLLGAGVLWYSFLEGRPELEQPGWMAVLFGQIGLLLGWAALVWARSQTPDREVLDRLNQMSDRLSTLETSTSLSNPIAHSFYNHLAAGAPTQMLLADLKGQLDLLATRLNRRQFD